VGNKLLRADGQIDWQIRRS